MKVADMLLCSQVNGFQLREELQTQEAEIKRLKDEVARHQLQEELLSRDAEILRLREELSKYQLKEELQSKDAEIKRLRQALRNSKELSESQQAQPSAARPAGDQQLRPQQAIQVAHDRSV